eukprot:3551366-Amphidinium_carterae.1
MMAIWHDVTGISLIYTTWLVHTVNHIQMTETNKYNNNQVKAVSLQQRQQTKLAFITPTANEFQATHI